MVVRFQRPAPPLRPFVQHYLLVHACYAGGGPTRAVKPMPPAPQQCLCFYPRDALRTVAHANPAHTRRLAGSFVVAPQLQRVDLHFGPDHLMLCAVFWPGGLQRLLGVPVKELLDVPVEGRALLGPAVADLGARLAELTDYGTMLAALETYLLDTLRRLRRLMVTIYVRYVLDPTKLTEFEHYGRLWLPLVARFGGQHHGYFLPSEGANNIALALFTFESLTAYERYRQLSFADPDCQAAFRYAEDTRCILSYERSFFRPVFS